MGDAWSCEKCGEHFNSKKEAVKHEKHCGDKTTNIWKWLFWILLIWMIINGGLFGYFELEECERDVRNLESEVSEYRADASDWEYMYRNLKRSCG